MHVVTEVGSDEAIARDGVVGEIAIELRERADVADAFGRTGTEVVGLVVEVDEGIVFGLIKMAAIGVD
jgi:hypothetical protein